LNCRPLHYQWSALPLSYGSSLKITRIGRKGPCHKARRRASAGLALPCPPKGPESRRLRSRCRQGARSGADPVPASSSSIALIGRIISPEGRRNTIFSTKIDASRSWSPDATKRRQPSRARFARADSCWSFAHRFASRWHGSSGNCFEQVDDAGWQGQRQAATWKGHARGPPGAAQAGTARKSQAQKIAGQGTRRFRVEFR